MVHGQGEANETLLQREMMRLRGSAFPYARSVSSPNKACSQGSVSRASSTSEPARGSGEALKAPAGSEIVPVKGGCGI